MLRRCAAAGEHGFNTTQMDSGTESKKTNSVREMTCFSLTLRHNVAHTC